MKYAITLGGGGTKGSYHIGVVKRLIEKYGYPSYISGTSVGALNGAMIASKKFDILEEYWRNLSEKNSIFKEYLFGKLEGIIFHRSLYSIKKLILDIEKIFNEEDLLKSDIKFISCFNDIETGNNIIFDNSTKWKGLLKDAIIASASISPAFPVHKVGNIYGGDGGYRSIIPVKELILDSIDVEKHFIIPAGIIGLNKYNYKSGNFLSDFMRTIDILYDEVIKGDLSSGLKIWTTDSKFIMIQPEKEFTSAITCINKEILANIEYGYNRAIQLNI